MKRTTKRRLGMAGLVVAGMMGVLLLVSFKVKPQFALKHIPAAPILADFRSAGIWLDLGVVTLRIPLDTSKLKGRWEFSDHVGRGSLLYTWVKETWPKFYRGQNGDPHNYLSVPLWIPTLLIAIPSFFLWRRNRKLPQEGHCECGYDLTGNVSGVCPECGKKLEEPNKADDNDTTTIEKPAAAQNEDSAT